MRHWLATLGCLLLAGNVPPAAAAELSAITVHGVEELRRAMAEVGPGDARTIRLDGGVYEFRDEPPDEDAFRCANAVLPAVEGSITLVGDGAVLQGIDGGSLTFCVRERGELNIGDVTVVGFGNPEAPYNVTLVHNQGTLRLDAVTLRDNPSSPGTLVLNDDEGRLEITASRFVGNTGGEAVLASYGRLAIRNSLFADNELTSESSASFSRPGAIRIARRGRTDVLNTTISGNTAGLFSVASDVELTHVTILDNEHGFRVWNGAAFVRNSIIAGSRIADCDFGPSATVVFKGTNLDSDASCGLDPETDLVGVTPGLRSLRPLDDGIAGHEPERDSPVLDRGDPAYCSFRDAAGRLRNTAADADPRCALGAIEPPNRPPHFEIDARLTGTWFDPDHDGHYLSVQVLPGGRLSALWWTYDRLGNPFWLVAAGVVSGGEAQLTAWESEGMRLPGLDDAEREVREWGTLELDFRGCRELELRWRTDRPGFADGRAELQRLTINAGLEC